MADLIARAREQGAVALADIAVALDASDLPAHTIDGVVRMLADEGVDILEAAPGEADGRRVAEPADESRRPVTSDLVRIYLREIGRVPLLTAEDEVELAKSIEAGLFAEEKLTGGFGCPGDVRTDLALLAAEGLRAKQRLIEANLRLVVSIAKRYQGTELTLLDLQGKHLVFIDTIGMSQKDRRVGEQTHMLSGQDHGVKRLLFLGRQAGQRLSRRVRRAGQDRIDQVDPLVGQPAKRRPAVARMRDPAEVLASLETVDDARDARGVHLEPVADLPERHRPATAS